MIPIPEVVRSKARAVGAADWLTALPETVATLEEEWSFRLGRIYDEGTEALVGEAEMVDGTAAVLKLLIPRDDLAVANEIAVLELVDGDACPRLYRSDPGRAAMLMEQLGPSLFSEGRPIEERQSILCELARRFWRPVRDIDLPTGADKGIWLIEFIEAKWELLGRPVSKAVVDHAVACARRRIVAHDAGRAVLVHGDIHEWNALASSGSYKLIDPDGLISEPEYDLGILMREDPVELMESDPRQRAQQLADLTGCDQVAVWEWGVVERVSTGLLLTEVGLQPVGSQMLEAAEFAMRAE